MVKAYLGLGSNMGDPVENLLMAAKELLKINGIHNLECSPVYRTAPVGMVDQNWFANAVVGIETELSAFELLKCCLEVEKEFKRVRIERWGPRTLDIDILLYANERIREKGLEIPHPRMLERAFVLAPLLDLEPSLSLNGRLLSESFEACRDQKVEKIAKD